MGDAEAGMAWSDIAKSAYRAYIASIGLPEPMYAWEALAPTVRTAWEAAVRQAGICLDLRGDKKSPDEQRWVGWQPPR